VNVHKPSDKWSCDDICTLFKCTKSTKCYGTLKAISRSSLHKCERWKNEKLLEEINTERVNCSLCSKKNKANQNSVQPGTEQSYEVIEKWCRTDDLYSQTWCGLTFAGDFYVILYLMRTTAS
jgi:hypothetical protein